MWNKIFCFKNYASFLLASVKDLKIQECEREELQKNTLRDTALYSCIFTKIKSFFNRQTQEIHE